MPEDLTALTISDAAELLLRRQLSPVELTEAVLTRIDDLDGTLRSYILVTGDEARAAAKAAEQEIAEGHYRGPLHGIPIGLKDLYNMAGVPTTAGSKFYRETPVADAPSVASLRAAGAVLTGKLNMHEFAFGADSLNVHFGYCRNPWDTERIAGGSSGGSGVAVAAGLCLAATGSDTGGSIRIPASVCGIVGFKPTRGLVSTRGLTPLSWTMDHAGPMTRTVSDAALMVRVMARFDPLDPYSVERPADDITVGLEKGIKGLRLGIPRNHFFEDTNPEVEQAVKAAADTMQGLGAEVSEVQLDMAPAENFAIENAGSAEPPGLRGIAGLWLAICCTEAFTFHRQFLAEHRGDYGQTLSLIELTGKMPAAGYVAAQRARDQLTISLERTLNEEVDLLLAPTTRTTAPTIDTALKGDTRLSLNTWIFNLTSQPSISMPCGFDSNGMPIGLMLSGRKWSDALVLRAAAAYEAATEWHGQMPVIKELETTG